MQVGSWWSKAAAAAIVALASTAALADDPPAEFYQLGLLQPGAPTSFTRTFDEPGPNYEIFHFSTAIRGRISVSIVNLPDPVTFPPELPSPGYNNELYSVGFFNVPDDYRQVTYVPAVNNGIHYVSDPLNPADYSIWVSNFANGHLGGVYRATLSVTPLPEPESYAMMLAGLGVVGWQVRRRKKTAARP